MPPKREIEAIVGALSPIDDKIELNRRMNRTLEEMAAALFRSWFVDFDPVVRRSGGGPTSGHNASVPFQSMDALFPDSFQDSEIGPIPRGWRVGKIGEMGRLVRDSVQPSATPGEMFDHYSIPAFDAGRTPAAEVGSQIKSNKSIVAPGCVMVSKLNPDTPRVWMPDLNPARRSICSTEFIVVLPQGVATREYLYGLFSSDDFAATFATLVTGTSNSHQRVQPGMLTAMDTVIPDSTAVRTFTQIVDPWLRQIAQNVRESQTLADLRDTLLPKLLSGEIRVKTAV